MRLKCTRVTSHSPSTDQPSPLRSPLLRRSTRNDFGRLVGVSACICVCAMSGRLYYLLHNALTLRWRHSSKWVVVRIALQVWQKPMCAHVKTTPAPSDQVNEPDATKITRCQESWLRCVGELRRQLYWCVCACSRSSHWNCGPIDELKWLTRARTTILKCC